MPRDRRKQCGHPDGVRRLVRPHTSAVHSCDGSTRQRHHALRLLPGITSAGVSRPFFSGCHSKAIPGNRTKSEVARVATLPAQKGQPDPSLVRLLIAAGQTWSRSRLHCHHTRRADPTVTCSARSSPLRKACHSDARSGRSAASELRLSTRFPAQNGQPCPPTRACALICQTCTGLARHFHQTLRVELAKTSAGVSSPFLVGCHSSATSGAHAASDRKAVRRLPAQNGHPVPRSFVRFA